MTEIEFSLKLENTDCISADEQDFSKESPNYDTKQSGDEARVMLELWEIQSIPGPLWPGVVAPDRVLSMGQIELVDILNCVLRHFKLCTSTF